MELRPILNDMFIVRSSSKRLLSKFLMLRNFKLSRYLFVYG